MVSIVDLAAGMNSDSLPPTPQPLTAEGAPIPDSDIGSAVPPLPNLATAEVMLTLEDVQKQLRRSRASVYRYANTEPEVLHPQFDPKKLNPEVRTHKEEPLKFHPREVRRFARDVLGLSPTIEVQTPPETVTQELLRAILIELKGIHETLKSKS